MARVAGVGTPVTPLLIDLVLAALIAFRVDPFQAASPPETPPLLNMLTLSPRRSTSSALCFTLRSMYEAVGIALGRLVGVGELGVQLEELSEQLEVARGELAKNLITRQADELAAARGNVAEQASCVLKAEATLEGALVSLVRGVWEAHACWMLFLAPRGPLRDPVAALPGPLRPLRGPVAAPIGPVADLSGPSRPPSRPRRRLYRPVAASSGPVAASSSPVAAPIGPVAASTAPSPPPCGRVAAPFGPASTPTPALPRPCRGPVPDLPRPRPCPDPVAALSRPSPCYAPTLPRPCPGPAPAMLRRLSRRTGGTCTAPPPPPPLFFPSPVAAPWGAARGPLSRAADQHQPSAGLHSYAPGRRLHSTMAGGGSVHGVIALIVLLLILVITAGPASGAALDAQLQVGTQGEGDCQTSQVRPLHHRCVSAALFPAALFPAALFPAALAPAALAPVAVRSPPPYSPPSPLPLPSLRPPSPLPPTLPTPHRRYARGHLWEDICGHAVCPTNFSCTATTDRRGVGCVCDGGTSRPDGTCELFAGNFSPPEPAPSATDSDVCGNSTRNPCKSGSCISGGPGSYSCVCPPLHVPDTRTNGYPTCEYKTSGLASTLEVQGDNWRCEDVYPLYGLTLDEFTAQNNGVDCTAALTRGQILNVTERDDLASCSVFYYIQPGDTCESVAASFGLSSSSLSLLNPGLDCSSPLPLSRSLCIERDDRKVGIGEECFLDASTVGSGTSSCTQVVEGHQLGSLLELYRLNPGLVCYTSLHADQEAGWPKICLKPAVALPYGGCGEGRARTFKASASCSSIINRAFGRSTELFEKYNSPCAGTIGGSSGGPVEICLPP
ncbi:unnamed protein product [Closterium sp. NIES-65]|nr:unnamed protein product [Closterium sp. NIES-65]